MALSIQDQSGSIVISKEEMENGGPGVADSICASKKLPDDLHMQGRIIKEHEDSLKFLKTQKNNLEDSILKKEVVLGKYYSSSQPMTEDQNPSHSQSKEEMMRQILRHEKSAAALFYQLKTRYATQASHLALTKDVLGIVAALGTVDDDNLSWEDVNVRFGVGSTSMSNLPMNYFEMENQVKMMKWKKEKLMEDFKREQSLLDLAKFNFELKKQEFVKSFTESSLYMNQHQIPTGQR